MSFIYNIYKFLMKLKKKKNFRTIILNKSGFQNILSSKKNILKETPNFIPFSPFEYSKTKENMHSSLNIRNKQNKVKLVNYKMFFNYDTYDESKDEKLPKIYGMKTINNEIKIYNSIDRYPYNIKLINKKYINSHQKNKFNSFDNAEKKLKININSPRFIRLNKFFESNITNNATKSSKKIKYMNDKIPNNKGYKNYIYNRMKLSYNKNFDSSFIHNLNSDFMIKLIEKKNRIILNTAKQYEIENKDAELLKEEKDKIDDKNLGKVKIFNKIRNYLINQYKKYFIGKEAKEFFSKKENRVNFLDDIYLLPNFKNNLIKQTYDSNKLDQKNFIEKNTIRYLNIAKIKIQKNKDEKDTSGYINEQINEYALDDTDIELDKNYTDKYDLYDMEDYLTKKKFNQSEVSIFNEKNKYLFYNTFMKLHDNMIIKHH